MVFNNMCRFKQDDLKCNRIFRPWDSASETQDNAQDSTVSTTTDGDESLQSESSEVLDEINVEDLETEKEGFRPLLKKEFQPKIESRSDVRIPPLHHQAYTEYPLDAFSVYPEVMQANMAQSLGLTPSDPLLLETMAHGYAMEEYARVLNQEHQAKILQARKQRPKKYKCPHCDVGFSNNGQLKGHIRIHTGERPFKCDEKDCGKTFTRNEELTRHKRIHSGLRPFPCTHCGKRFGRKDHLKKHSRTHFQPRGLYAVPVMLPFEAWASSSTNYPFVPMFGY